MTLTLQFIPYGQIEDLSSTDRIKKVLSLVKTDRILVLEGRLKSEEEAELIAQTMASIDKKFSGIELAVIFPDKKSSTFSKRIRQVFINLLLGDRQGLTIIGPANVVKEIKQDPEKIQLFTKKGKV